MQALRDEHGSMIEAIAQAKSTGKRLVPFTLRELTEMGSLSGGAAAFMLALQGNLAAPARRPP